MSDQPRWAGDTLAEFDEIKRLQAENADLLLTIALLEARVAQLERCNDTTALDVVKITRLEARLLTLDGQLRRSRGDDTSTRRYAS
jgi:hypothetical protein